MPTSCSDILKPTFPKRVAMAQAFQDPASLSWISTEPFLRTHGAQTQKRTKLWVLLVFLASGQLT